MNDRAGTPHRAAFVLEIRPDRVADYVAAHASVWPDMLAALTAAGIRNYSIFLNGAQAFGYFEAEDLEGARSRLEASVSSKRWQRAMADLLVEPVPTGGPEPLREIFRLD